MTRLYNGATPVSRLKHQDRKLTQYRLRSDLLRGRCIGESDSIEGTVQRPGTATRRC